MSSWSPRYSPVSDTSNAAARRRSPTTVPGRGRLTPRSLRTAHARRATAFPPRSPGSPSPSRACIEWYAPAAMRDALVNLFSNDCGVVCWGTRLGGTIGEVMMDETNDIFCSASCETNLIAKCGDSVCLSVDAHRFLMGLAFWSASSGTPCGERASWGLTAFFFLFLFSYNNTNSAVWKSFNLRRLYYQSCGGIVQMKAGASAEVLLPSNRPLQFENIR
jgi:hypothetical protein